MVTDSPSEAARGGGESRQPLVRYSEKFEELCPQYMALGMSYHDFWDGDATMARYYRQADEYRQEQANFMAWLQGLYIYRALVDVAPVFNPMSKKKTPRQYLSEPIPTTKRGNREAEEAEKWKKMEAGKNAMMAMMTGFNAKFKKGGVKDGD